MKKLLLLLICTLMGVGLAACDPDEGQWVGPHPATDPPPRIWLVGDSLIDGWDDKWQAGSMVQQHPTAIWSVGGTKLQDTGPQNFLMNTTPRPEVAIIALGTNDTRVGGDGGWTQDDANELNHLLSLVIDVPCIVLVNIGYGPGAPADFKLEVPKANSTINALASTRIKVVNWRGWSAWDPTWFQADGIHLTEVGQDGHQRLITHAVTEHLNSGLCSR